MVLIAALACSACTVAGVPVATDASPILNVQPPAATVTARAIPASASPLPATGAGLPTATVTATSTAATTQPATPTVAVTAVATPVPTPVATRAPTPVPFATFGGGQKTVGADIAPGTYRTRVAPGPNCSWQRIGANGQVVASEYPHGPTIVTIAPTDRYFLSQDCPTWTQDLSPLKSPISQFGAGTFFVGTEVAPGTWQGSAGGIRTCTWARLSGFGSGDGFGTDRSGIIANGGVQSGYATVTIAAGDKGFTSDGCLAWTKSG